VTDWDKGQWSSRSRPRPRPRPDLFEANATILCPGAILRSRTVLEDPIPIPGEKNAISDFPFPQVVQKH